MKRILIISLVLAALLFAACAGDPEPAPLGPAPEYQQQTDAYTVVDHKTMALGQDVPEWVTRYMSDGVGGVEAMPLYEGKYVFIGEDSGTNLNALRQWSTGFTVAQDMSRMVSTRVQARFAGAATGSPDDEYGRYFESVVKSASDASYSGARRETDFWVLKRFYEADGKKIDREEYDYYVLVSIDKELLQQQIDDVLDGVELDTAPTEEETTAYDRVKEAFYEGF
jgi:hypothetical protein